MRHSKIGTIKFILHLNTAWHLQTHRKTAWLVAQSITIHGSMTSKLSPSIFSTVQSYLSVFGHVSLSVSVSDLEAHGHIMRKQQAINPPPDGLLYQQPMSLRASVEKISSQCWHGGAAGSLDPRQLCYVSVGGGIITLTQVGRYTVVESQLKY